MTIKPELSAIIPALTHFFLTNCWPIPHIRPNRPIMAPNCPSQMSFHSGFPNILAHHRPFPSFFFLFSFFFTWANAHGAGANAPGAGLRPVLYTRPALRALSFLKMLGGNASVSPQTPLRGGYAPTPPFFFNVIELRSMVHPYGMV